MNRDGEKIADLSVQCRSILAVRPQSKSCSDPGVNGLLERMDGKISHHGKHP